MIRTEQEDFWAGSFGDEYAQRNIGRITSNMVFLAKALNSASGFITSVAEVGAGSGENLLALQRLLPNANFAAIDVNRASLELLHKRWPTRNAMPHLMCGTIAEHWEACTMHNRPNLVLSKGVLIHIPPEKLEATYRQLYNMTSRYVLLAEYYNPTPVAIEYRGHAARMWKRDFAGDMLDMFTGLRLVDYGFVYHRTQFPQDDLTWFLLERTQP